MLILHLPRSEEMYGYQLTQEIGKRSSEHSRSLKVLCILRFTDFWTRSLLLIVLSLSAEDVLVFIITLSLRVLSIPVDKLEKEYELTRREYRCIMIMFLRREE